MNVTAWSGFSGATVAADELASALYHPTSGTGGNTFAVMHGHLDQANWTGTIPTWAVQEGTFFCGFHHGWERWDFTYALQQEGTNYRGLQTGLTRRFFMPWDARLVLFGYNAWCRPDASYLSGSFRESWTLSTYLDDTVLNEMECNIPHGKDSTSSDNHAEDRWRFVTPCGAKMPASTSSAAAVAKGYHHLKVKVYGTIDDTDDTKNEKMVIPTGALWMFAIRS